MKTILAALTHYVALIFYIFSSYLIYIFIYQKLLLTNREYTFLECTGLSLKIATILHHKRSLSKFQRISNINYCISATKHISKKIHMYRNPQNTQLNNSLIKEVTTEISKYLELISNKNTTY